MKGFAFPGEEASVKAAPKPLDEPAKPRRLFRTPRKAEASEIDEALWRGVNDLTADLDRARLLRDLSSQRHESALLARCYAHLEHAHAALEGTVPLEDLQKEEEKVVEEEGKAEKANDLAAALEEKLVEARDHIRALIDKPDEDQLKAARESLPEHTPECSICKPGHPKDSDGLCERHGKRIPAESVAATVRDAR